jgi:hypothetical protein
MGRFPPEKHHTLRTVTPSLKNRRKAAPVLAMGRNALRLYVALQSGYRP